MLMKNYKVLGMAGLKNLNTETNLFLYLVLRSTVLTLQSQNRIQEHTRHKTHLEKKRTPTHTHTRERTHARTQGSDEHLNKE